MECDVSLYEFEGRVGEPVFDMLKYLCARWMDSKVREEQYKSIVEKYEAVEVWE